MADYKVTAAQLASIANAIRLKGGTSASLVYPTDWITAIQNLVPASGGSSITPADPTMEYKVTDTDLIAIANAIRTKGGTSASLEFPTEFVAAIEAIQSTTQLYFVVPTVITEIGSFTWYQDSGESEIRGVVIKNQDATYPTVWMVSRSSGHVDIKEGGNGISREVVSQSGEYYYSYSYAKTGRALRFNNTLLSMYGHLEGVSNNIDTAISYTFGNNS